MTLDFGFSEEPTDSSSSPDTVDPEQPMTPDDAVIDTLTGDDE